MTYLDSLTISNRLSFFVGSYWFVSLSLLIYPLLTANYQIGSKLSNLLDKLLNLDNDSLFASHPWRLSKSHLKTTIF